MNKLGEQFRAKAYKTASTAIAQYPDKITTPAQLKSIKGVGDSSIKHIMEFLNTGQVTYIETLKSRPEILFTTVSLSTFKLMTENIFWLYFFSNKSSFSA